MQQGSRFFTIISVLVVGVMLQIMLVFADQRGAPAKTAVAFSKAYFGLDPAMDLRRYALLRSDEVGKKCASRDVPGADTAELVVQKKVRLHLSDSGGDGHGAPGLPEVAAPVAE